MSASLTARVLGSVAVLALLISGCADDGPAGPAGPAGSAGAGQSPDPAGSSEPGVNPSTERGAATAPCDAVADDDLATWFHGEAWVAGPTRNGGDEIECRSITDPDLDTSATWTFQESSGSHAEDVERNLNARGKRRHYDLPSGAPAVLLHSTDHDGSVTVVSWPDDGGPLVVDVLDLDLGSDVELSPDDVEAVALGITESYDS